ncbi:hypothetical protein [Tranquillimonas alkanivorans]|uniref:Uncharacterized protein n=1 Tax=Tranquillimonas alkanivorans TaxID=441119 RepID=A0A1I5PM15_9RHOB|nr:hypothetical protein [Tranquillimonas alkanivorans]SFP35063.1 hypothetical protein SAMN04488047_105165 [Tranquillimonas alkanivorans]
MTISDALLHFLEVAPIHEKARLELIVAAMHRGDEHTWRGLMAMEFVGPAEEGHSALPPDLGATGPSGFGRVVEAPEAWPGLSGVLPHDERVAWARLAVAAIEAGDREALALIERLVLRRAAH